MSADCTKGFADRKVENLESQIQARAIKRDETPEDLVGAVFFLASPDADFISGQTINVDGASICSDLDRHTSAWRNSMADIPRINVQEARRKTQGGEALLVCAYEDDAKCRMLNLEGSISLTGLESRVGSLPKTQEIIFYCA